jgi:hypothetical protein
MRRLAICWFGLFLALLGPGLLGGCGPKGPTRCEISGKVLLDGQPIEEGVIQFDPLDGQATMDSSIILKGAYQIPKNKGLFPGRYLVRIMAGDGYSGAGRAEPGSGQPTEPGVKRGVDRAPEEYNTKSTQTVEVKETGNNIFDYDVPRRKS